MQLALMLGLLCVLCHCPSQGCDSLPPCQVRTRQQASLWKQRYFSRQEIWHHHDLRLADLWTQEKYVSIIYSVSLSVGICFRASNTEGDKKVSMEPAVCFLCVFPQWWFSFKADDSLYPQDPVLACPGLCSVYSNIYFKATSILSSKESLHMNESCSMPWIESNVQIWTHRSGLALSRRNFQSWNLLHR